jgi:glycosyltransferase involved in cell wall biosynthesis
MEPTEEQTRDLTAQFTGSVRYHGLLEADDLVRRRREYAYSIVMWNPTISDNHLYAAPNRLFTSIQAGVPPIVAPHPQCRIMVDRYDCGLVMRDWSFEAFHDALRLGMKLYGTSRYAELVENCRRAAATELNWDAQFNKIRRFLPTELS